MTSRLRCQCCHRRIGRRATVLLLDVTAVLCPECSIDPKAHTAIWFGCPKHHAPAEHLDNPRITAGLARLLINRQGAY